jgi:hypothetical protein
LRTSGKLKGPHGPSNFPYEMADEFRFNPAYVEIFWYIYSVKMIYVDENAEFMQK